MASLSKIQLIVILYALSQITMVIGMATNSFYLRWWWECLFNKSSKDSCEWETYYLFLIILDAVVAGLFWFSGKLIVSAALCREQVVTRETKRLALYALVGQLVVFIIPLGILWIDDVVDHLFELWMVWNTVNIGLCTAAWSYMNIFLVKEESGYRLTA